MWSFFGSKRVTDKRLENALKSRAGIIQEIINKFKMLGKPENSTFSGFFLCPKRLIPMTKFKMYPIDWTD